MPSNVPGASYEKRLQELVENVPGAVSASLTGIDGIGIAAYLPASQNPSAGASLGGAGLDPTMADAEFATILTTANRAARNLEVGEISELLFSSERVTYILRMVGGEFFLAVGLAPGPSNLGMARLQMRWAAEDFAKALL